MSDNQQGISNRESAAEEAEERKEFPPVTPDATHKVAGASGEEPGPDQDFGRPEDLDTPRPEPAAG